MVSSGYFVKVEDYCLGNSCLKQNGFEAQIDSGSSFTYIPYEAYKLVVAEVLSFLLPFPAAPFSPHSLPFPFEFFLALISVVCVHFLMVLVMF